MSLPKWLRTATLFTLLAGCLSCVPKEQYDALVIERDYYRNKAVTSDSIADARVIDSLRTPRVVEDDLTAMIRKMESLKATNIALNESYQALSTRYDDLLAQNQKLLHDTGERVTGVQEQLAERRRELERREARLRERELELEERLRERPTAADLTPAGSPGPDNGVVAEAAGRSREQEIARRVNELRSNLNQALSYLPEKSYVVAPAGTGRLKVSLADGLITQQGGGLSTKGKQVVSQLATGLQSARLYEIFVVGHVDNTAGNATEAYEDSSDRAILLANELIRAGLPASRITPAGMGFANPVVSNSTPEGRSANRRYEVLITLI